MELGPVAPLDAAELAALEGRFKQAQFRPPVILSGVTMAEFAANLSVALGRCSHDNAVPVDTLLGERVAVLCPDCDTQLPATWRCASD